MGCFKYHDNDDGDDDEDEFQNKKQQGREYRSGLSLDLFCLSFPHSVEKVVFVMVISRLLTSAGP